MDNVVDVLHAVMTSYSPESRNDLTTSKANLLIYLIDWHLRINNKQGISGLNWINESFGPSAAEVKNALERRSLFRKNIFKTKSGREVVSHTAIGSTNSVSSDTKKSVDHVIKLEKQRRSTTSSDTGAEFKRLVLSTYGVMHTEKGAPIDIGNQADRYRNFLLLAKKKSQTN